MLDYAQTIVCVEIHTTNLLQNIDKMLQICYIGIVSLSCSACTHEKAH